MEPFNRALEDAFKEQRRGLVRMLAQLVGDASIAEDLAQEAYVKAVTAKVSEAVQSPEAFLYRIARNLAIDYGRRGQIERRIFAAAPEPDTFESVASTMASPEESAANRQLVDALDAALKSVPNRARQVMILHRVEGWTLSEVSAHFGVSVTTIQKDLRLAMAQCMDAMVDNGEL